MAKKILIVFGIIFVAIIGFCLYLLNPYDAQYKSFYTEKAAYEAFQKGDMDTFIKYMSTPVTLKYHAPFLLYLTLMNMGRYDEAIEAVNKFERYRDYSACVQYKYGMRIFCRVTDILFPIQLASFDKNYWLSKIYFDKGDYETALKYNSLSKEQAPCFKVKLYSALGDFKEADKNVKLCENQYASRKDKYVLYSAKGYMYLRRKKYDVAYDYLMKSIKKGSGKYIGNKESYLLLARLYEEINELDKARYYYELVIKTDPFNYRAQRGLGLILQHKK